MFFFFIIILSLKNKKIYNFQKSHGYIINFDKSKVTFFNSEIVSHCFLFLDLFYN